MSGDSIAWKMPENLSQRPFTIVWTITKQDSTRTSLNSSTFELIQKVIRKVCIDDNVLNVFATRNLLCRNLQVGVIFVALLISCKIAPQTFPIQYPSNARCKTFRFKILKSLNNAILNHLGVVYLLDSEISCFSENFLGR